MCYYGRPCLRQLRPENKRNGSDPADRQFNKDLPRLCNCNCIRRSLGTPEMVSLYPSLNRSQPQRSDPEMQCQVWLLFQLWGINDQMCMHTLTCSGSQRRSTLYLGSFTIKSWFSNLGIALVIVLGLREAAGLASRQKSQSKSTSSLVPGPVLFRLYLTASATCCKPRGRRLRPRFWKPHPWGNLGELETARLKRDVSESPW